MFSLKTAVLASLTYVGLAVAQANSPYCDAFSNICYQGYYDATYDITIGLILPPLTTGTTPNYTEFLGEIIAPVSYGWTGLSIGGTMAESLLFTVWPYNGQVMFGPRWTSGYVQPLPYAGPVITLLPDSVVNSTHIKASFRCQNCTTWEEGSLGYGDLSAFQLIAYVASDTTPVDDPSSVASNMTEHDIMNFFGMELSEAHTTTTTLYDSYLGPTVAKYGQCGGTSGNFKGPYTCAVGSTCTAIDPPYYYQCV
ncbi:carbohydrate-binding module 1 protein [Jaapia argillacea MUCL 33604]|uniref:Carbohydrate-binding module 1 protein n=1 Tax=Jaapia argillacea MUCL 33604 TaxID=933084 RepID=A0A067Q1V9_9AGAM|nr:carbohydrate-binding module 1 protein [Jaapia argillacea MUCL 33604]